jgi:methylated-DNA-protein-cysteine methyltransferase related protein
METEIGKNVKSGRSSFPIQKLPCDRTRQEGKMDARFSSPPDPAAFQAQVWEIVRQIPTGKVSTYGKIAALIPPPGKMNLKDYLAWGARWVGGAMSACPEDVPWQRVINAQGKISLRPGSGHLRQRQLLEDEGVEFDVREKIDLARFGWEGPPPEWLEAHGLVSVSG